MISNNDFSKKQQAFLAKIDKALNDFNLIQPTMSLLCAVSGGPDSICLLAVCEHFSKKYDFKLAVAHVHHGLRGTHADRDAVFVERLAQQAKLPFHMERADVIAFQKKYKLCLEEAARELRYNALTNICKKYDYQAIAIGHHADDTAEQLLMNLLRGTGPQGLSGIVPKRNLVSGRCYGTPSESVQIIRPLILVYRKDIMTFLSEIHQSYVLDESNQDIRFLRNRVRHELIPVLQTYNPNITLALNRLADIQRTNSHWLKTITDALLHKILIKMDAQQMLLNMLPLVDQHQAVIRNLFRRAIQRIKGDLRRITHDHILVLSEWVRTPEKSRHMHLPDNICVHFFDEKIRIFQHSGVFNPYVAPKFCYCIEKPGKINIPECNMVLQLDLQSENLVNTKINFTHSDFSVSRSHVYLDADKVRFPMMVRNIETGDRFQPSGMNGHQKLKKFFINQKVPRSKRSQAAVLVSQNKIVWVIGYRIAQPAMITVTTQKLLECKYTHLTDE
ncbi:MAG: tRNA lysidine(34) synthetase TilS [Candidatus Magnetomorum sp.]|nr:tRNA lysidine(34) synthetase TilS [Candidatus Magnetomorum sp.]